MLLNKPRPASPGDTKIVSIRGYSRRLESLYARRSAVEALIHSLEDYQRFRERQLVHQQESKTA